MAMASITSRRAALRLLPRLVSRAAPLSTSARHRASADPAAAGKPPAQAVLQKETKANPELYILGGVMVAALAGAGYYFGRSPTHATSEANVTLAKEAMPWEGDPNQATAKYRYHPSGDKQSEPRDAPSALNVVVIPDVTLPQELHDKFNKWGKDEFP